MIFVNFSGDGFLMLFCGKGGGVHDHEGQVELAVCESDLAVFGA